MSGKRLFSIIAAAKAPLFIITALFVFAFAVGSLEKGGREEGKRRLEESLRLSAAACYAAEGIYPPTVDYMVEHYGLMIDNDRYAVHYEIFAENIMPEITVVELPK